jgi:5-methylcytosine-specific restriction endonuclease McrA
VKRTPLARRTALPGTGRLRRGARLRPRSAKTGRAYVARRALVARLLTERPHCEIRWDARCTVRATEVDEVLLRSRGGSILDEDNCQTTCRPCHRAKTEHPAEAQRRGLTRSSWEAGA